MKILCLGDLHLRYRRPEYRIDDFFVTQFNKLQWVFDLAVREKCKVVIMPGDVFDSFSASYLVVSTFLFHLWRYSKQFKTLAVYGQHDMRYHSTRIDNTPLHTVESSGLLKVLDHNPYQLFDSVFYGASWGCEIPQVKTEGTNILVTHRMVIKSDKLWEGQSDFEYSRRLLRTTGYDLIVSGDNHNFFVDEYKGRFLINCGSLCRMKTDQAEHKPSVVVYDTKAKDIKVFEIPVEPAEKVFDLATSEKKKEKEKMIEVFVDSLSESKELGLDFMSNLWKFVRDNNVSEEVVKVIEEVLKSEEDIR